MTHNTNPRSYDQVKTKVIVIAISFKIAHVTDYHVYVWGPEGSCMLKKYRRLRFKIHFGDILNENKLWEDFNNPALREISASIHGNVEPVIIAIPLSSNCMLLCQL